MDYNAMIKSELTTTLPLSDTLPYRSSHEDEDARWRPHYSHGDP